MFRFLTLICIIFTFSSLHAQEIEDSLLPPLVKNNAAETETNNDTETSLPEITIEEKDEEINQPTKQTNIEDAESQPVNIQNVKLRGLNKVTARQSILEQRIGYTSYFGNLEILAEKCWVAPPEDSPESKVLLDIWEQKPNEEKKRIFYGWMFASSPGLVSLEHPVYDINVLGCY